MEPVPTAPAKESSYPAWVENTARLRAAELEEIRDHCREMIEKPVFAVFVRGTAAPEGWNLTLASLKRQIYPHWNLHLLGAPAPVSPSPDVTVAATVDWDALSADFAVFVEAGDVLAADCLYEFASEINRDPAGDLLYANEDRRTASGERHTPFFKPAWSPDYLESLPYIGHAACFRVSIAAGCPFADFHDFLLRFTEKTRRIAHLEKVLYHRADSRPLPSPEIGTAAIRGRLERTGRQGEIVTHGRGAYFEIVPRLRRAPLVSIVIPTAGGIASLRGSQVNLIENCVTSIREKSTYSAYEFVIVHDGGLPASTLALLQEHQCRLVHYGESPLNLSRKLNQGAAQAQGEYLILMNDDIEVITPDWIERMLAHFEKEATGVVGCKLLGENGKVRHAGVVNNFGLPVQVSQGVSSDDPGYFHSLQSVRNYIAVSGACCMTPHRLFAELGGYEEKLGLCFNDVDYCLRVAARGLTRLCDCFVKMLHLESPVRAPKEIPQEQDLYFRLSWPTQLGDDPYYDQGHLSMKAHHWKFSVEHHQL